MTKSTTLVLLATFCNMLSTIDCLAATAQLKPVLKAIDPSQAKLDTPPPVLPPPSPNPLGRITGAPISSPRKPLAARSSRMDLPPASPAPNIFNSAASAPQVYDSNVGFNPSTDRPVPRQNSRPDSFPNEDLIPEFGQELPFNKLRNHQSTSNYGQGWTTQAPAVSNPAPIASAQEVLITRLEHIAFGSTYPEHDLPDRIDHLEKEVFGQISSDNPGNRLSRLESRLAGQSAFGQPLANQ